MTNDGRSSPHDPWYLHELTEAQRAELDRIETEMGAILNEGQPESSYPIDTKARDRNAIDDEQMFNRRFGFDWPRSDRIAVIELKHRLDLTDREIRLLKWTGNLKRKHGIVTLASARWAAIFGRSLIVAAFVEFAGIMLIEALATHHALSALQVLKLYAATAFVLVMLWLVHLGYIRPWLIEQRVMKKTAPDAQHADQTG